ncbi:MAG: class I SAM-dependent methyltransferase [Bacteroidota bacterium]
MTRIMNMNCPLCQATSEKISPVEGRLQRRYLHCANCQLIFTHPDDLPRRDEEQTRYQEHENTIEAPGYVKFLNQAIEPTLPFLSADMRGLDYGSGPGPTLSQLLGRNGIRCLDYDPIFGPELPKGPFDFIFSTETFEHFHHPGREMDRIEERLKPGGILTIMTMFRPSLDEFPKWFYPGDYTHVTFFNLETFEFICRKWNYHHLWDDGKRVIILKKL